MAHPAVYQWILDRSTTPLARIAGCGLIASIIFGVTMAKHGRGAWEWWQGAAMGGFVGLAAGLGLTLYDRSRDPALDPVRRRLRLFGLVVYGVLFVIGLCVVIDLTVK